MKQLYYNKKPSVQGLTKAKIYIGIAIAAVPAAYGVYSFVHDLGAKDAIKENDNTELVKTVAELNTTVKEQGVLFLRFDSVLKTQLTSSQTQEAEYKKLIRNYSNFVQANTKSVQEWKEYMQGLTFEVVQEPTKSNDDLKIIITPVK